MIQDQLQQDSKYLHSSKRDRDEQLMANTEVLSLPVFLAMTEIGLISVLSTPIELVNILHPYIL